MEKDINILRLLIHVARFPIREVVLIYIPLVVFECHFSEHYKNVCQLDG